MRPPKRNRCHPKRIACCCGESRCVAAAPETLTLKTNRDRKNWWQSIWIRRALLVVPAAFLVVGLANLLGQRPSTLVGADRAARLEVTAPTHARSGLIYAARFRIYAKREIKNAMLVLEPGWADGYTVNGEAPQPLTQGSHDGQLQFGFGHIPQRQALNFWLSLQVNPTTVGHHAQSVRLYDGTTLLLTLHRSVFIFP